MAEKTLTDAVSDALALHVYERRVLIVLTEPPAAEPAPVELRKLTAVTGLTPQLVGKIMVTLCDAGLAAATHSATWIATRDGVRSASILRTLPARDAG